MYSGHMKTCPTLTTRIRVNFSGVVVTKLKQKNKSVRLR